MIKVKKHLVFLVVFSFITSLAFGQGAPAPAFGAKGGFNISGVGGDTDNTAKFSGHVGLYSEVYFDYFLMSQAEVVFAWIGHGGDPSLNLAYIQFPLLIRYNWDYNFNVHLGIQPAVLLSANQKSGDTKVKVKDQFKGFDFGLPVGIGWDFAERKYNITARYIFGLNNISDVGGTRRNNVLEVSLGIKLHQGI